MPSSYSEENERPDLDGISALAEHVVYRVPGCAEVMIRKALSETYRDFCRRTCVLRTVRDIELESGTNDYPLVPRHFGCMVDSVVEASVGGRVLPMDGYSYCGGDFIHLCGRELPAEGETRTLRVTCVEVPVIGSDRASRLFAERYGDAIVSGALMRLFAMSDRPWSDPQQSMLEARLYENACTENRVRYHSGGNLSSGAASFYKKGLII